jgi:hypothetical protein
MSAILTRGSGAGKRRHHSHSTMIPDGGGGGGLDTSTKARLLGGPTRARTLPLAGETVRMLVLARPPGEVVVWITAEEEGRMPRWVPFVVTRAPFSAWLLCVRDRE